MTMAVAQLLRPPQSCSEQETASIVTVCWLSSVVVGRRRQSSLIKPRRPKSRSDPVEQSTRELPVLRICEEGPRVAGLASVPYMAMAAKRGCMRSPKTKVAVFFSPLRLLPRMRLRLPHKPAM